MIHAKNVRHVFKKCSSCQQKYFLSLFNIVFNFLSLFDTENIFLPYLALSLNFVPFITLPSILSFNSVKCHLKEHFTPHVACDQNLPLPPFLNISLFRDFNKRLHTEQNE